MIWENLITFTDNLKYVRVNHLKVFIMNFRCWLIISREIEINFRKRKKLGGWFFYCCCCWCSCFSFLFFFAIYKTLHACKQTKTFLFNERWNQIHAMWLIVKTLKSVFGFSFFLLLLLIPAFSLMLVELKNAECASDSNSACTVHRRMCWFC